MTVDISLDSVWPSVILHFINNAVSVVMMKYVQTSRATLIFAVAMLGCALLASVFIYRKRREYCKMLVCAFERGDRGEFTYATVMLTLVCGYLATVNLFS